MCDCIGTRLHLSSDPRCVLASSCHLYDDPRECAVVVESGDDEVRPRALRVREERGSVGGKANDRPIKLQFAVVFADTVRSESTSIVSFDVGYDEPEWVGSTAVASSHCTGTGKRDSISNDSSEMDSATS